MQKTIEGLGGIKATVIADSISEAGVRLTTFEIEVPRIVWSEFMTHRQFSRNAASSRAIPFAKMQEQLKGAPVSFGKNQTGMQAGEEHTELVFGELSPETAWECAKKDAVSWSKAFADAGFHKQVFNRLTEAFQVIKAVVSATEYDNFFWLRDDDAADPTIAELARCMKEAQEKSIPNILKAGEYHLPYVKTFWKDGKPCGYYINGDDITNDVEEAIKVSCARCAAVSYRNEGYGLEKSKELYERLVGADKKHASALEHCATPMQPTSKYVNDVPQVNIRVAPSTWEDGISHVDRNGKFWSGNFKGFIQHRKTVKGECFNG